MAKIREDILEAYIYPSKIGGKDSFYARPGEVVFHDLEDTMQEAGFSDEEKATFIALSSRIKQVGKELTAKGQGHNNGFFETYFSISGAFDSADDPFKPERNEVHLHARLERDWQQYVQMCKVSTQPVPTFSAKLTTANNFSTGTQWNDQKILAVSNGNLVILQGENLKVSGTNSGLELSQIGNYNIELIRSFSTNQPKELQFLFPNISAGTYSVTLKTNANGSREYASQRQALLSLQFQVS